jgi:hypothetical protein
MKSFSFFNILSSILYAVVLIFILHFINIFLDILFGYIVGPVFDWFYRINLFYKICLIFIGAPLILYSLFNLSKFIGLHINGFISKIFKVNFATLIISMILVISNIILSIIDIWYLLHWDFSIIILWLIMVIFIFEINMTFLLNTNKKAT